MKAILFLPIFLIALLSLSMASALIVDAEYVTLYPGEEGRVILEIENNENFDIEDVSVQLVFSGILPDGTIVNLPFTTIGSSEKTTDDLDEDDDDTVSFNLRPSTDITPGDYNLPYIISYFEDGEDEKLTQEGSFGLRVSAKTDLDFGVEAKGENTDSPILNQDGSVSLEIINEGLGDIKSVSVQIFPEGFELLSKEKIFVGTIDSDDTDFVTFDVIYKSSTPVLKAKITYKDFDNNEETENIAIPFKVYTQEEALQLGIIKQSSVGLYVGIIIVLVIIWFIWRKIRKSKRRNKKKK